MTWLPHRVGSEHDPGDPFGRVGLAVDADGGLRPESVTRAVTRAVARRGPPETLDRLRALHAAT